MRERETERINTTQSLEIVEQFVTTNYTDIARFAHTVEPITRSSGATCRRFLRDHRGLKYVCVMCMYGSCVYITYASRMSETASALAPRVGNHGSCIEPDGELHTICPPPHIGLTVRGAHLRLSGELGVSTGV